MTLRIKGKVTSGTGRAAKFLSLDWVHSQIKEKFGFFPYKGTLNLAIDERTSENYRIYALTHPGILVEPVVEGYSSGKFFSVRIDGRIDGAIVIPQVLGYPRDLVEIIAPVNLRDRIGLKDGDEVAIEILDD